MRQFPLLLRPILLFSLLVSLTLPPQDLDAQDSAEAGKAIIILDASGSMWGQIGGEHKIEIARRVISDLMETLPAELQLGLMAYGHRQKGDCDDIELLIPPGPVDRKQFLDIVTNILPKGKTPLTDAVEQAAAVLQIEENPATVILISDGIETCDRDPCELAAQLAQRGIRFKTHIVAFDLTSDEAESIRCLAEQTGGRFLPAGDAESLQHALTIAVNEAGARTVEDEKMPPEDLSEATLMVPDSVQAGSSFPVQWEGPNNRTDYVTVVSPEAEDRIYDNFSYVHHQNPVELLAPIEAGSYEVRYIAGESGRVLGRAGIEVTPVTASLEVPDEVVAGSGFPVEWTGPNLKGDYLTIVGKGAESDAYNDYKFTAGADSLQLRAMDEPGEAEVRYVTGQDTVVLAAAPIRILPAEAIVSGPEKVAGGSEVQVKWKGPANKGDYITIVKEGSPAGEYNKWKFTAGLDSDVVALRAPEEAGDYEIRYLSGQDTRILASALLEVAPLDATLTIPDKVIAGSKFEVRWTGPNNEGDYLTIVKKGAPDDEYNAYFYAAKEDPPTGLRAMDTPGQAEVRYLTDDGKVLARAGIEIVPSDVTLKAPARATAGESITIEWTGPDNEGDYLTIVPKGAGEGEYGDYEYTKAGSPVEIDAPDVSGAAEIRYVSGQSDSTLKRQPIEVVKE